MRRLALIAIVIGLVGWSLPSFGGLRDNVAVTPEGVVYSVDLEIVDPDSIPVKTILNLTTQKGAEVTVEPIPATLDGSLHVLPAIAWDYETDTVFVFWLNIRSLVSTELLFTSKSSEGWSEATSIEGGVFHYRENLRITTTHSTTVFDEDGNPGEQVPGLRVHAVWWDDDGSRSEAHYAQLTILDGAVAAIETAALIDIVPPQSESFLGDENLSSHALRHPSVQTAPDGASVRIVFGDHTAQALRTIDIIPVANGVLTIPIGVRPAPDLPDMIPAPLFSANYSIRSDFIFGSGPNDIIAWTLDPDGTLIRFRRWNGESWSSESILHLNERFTADIAIEGLYNLIRQTRPHGLLTIPIG
ncbi:MAG: hypothetical protein KY459_09470 [Acidobacteria bacterium]|nr:hypothetical protein [Acidobacteriota bacterium]